MRRKIIWILALAVLVSPRLSVAYQENINTDIKNESSLQYESGPIQPRIDDVVGATFCKGTLSNPEDLEKIGLSEADLRNGVHCTVGDFDGNGYMDFALWGNSKPRSTQNYLVLFFDRDKLIRSTIIESKHSGRLLVYYSPRKSIGKYGEPISDVDGLFEIGETGGYDDETKGTVYLFDSKLGNFRKVKFGGEK